MRYTPQLDNNIVLSMLLIGLALMWSAFATFTMKHWDIGIDYWKMIASNVVLGCVSTIFSLISMRHCEMRFSMTFFFLSIMVMITCCTPLITGHATDEMAVCLLPLLFCGLSMLRHKDWIIFIAVLFFLVSEVCLWTSFGDYTFTVFLGYGVSGMMFVYYACGIFLYRDVGSDLLNVTSSEHFETTVAEPLTIFETVNNVIVGILMFFVGVYLYTEELTAVTCVPVMVVSSFVIVVAFFGMERGFISSGLLALILGLYFMCKSFSVFTTGTASIEMLAIIMVIPLLVLLYIFHRERDYINIIACVILIAYFLVAGLMGYVDGISVLLTVLAFLFIYCGICSLVKQEFSVELPFYRFV